MVNVSDLRGQTMGGSSGRQTVTKIVRHHSATSSGNVRTFERYWRSKGWQTGGYHEVILRDGTVERCYEWDVITNGVKGHNETSYHICLVGRGQFTTEQERVFKERIETWLDQFQLSVSDVVGHNELAEGNTQCPGINMNLVRTRLKEKTQSTILRQGDQGEAVRQLQETLISRGYDLPQFGADGLFGNETKQTVQALQRDAQITVDGIVGPETRRALNEQLTLPAGIYRRGSRGQAVSRIQRVLQQIGFSPGAIDGIYGPHTAAAVQQFQRQHVPNEVDGIYGPNTRAAMKSALT